jgi:uncharacterized membrane protein
MKKIDFVYPLLLFIGFTFLVLGLFRFLNPRSLFIIIGSALVVIGLFFLAVRINKSLN